MEFHIEIPWLFMDAGKMVGQDFEAYPQSEKYLGGLVASLLLGNDQLKLWNWMHCASQFHNFN